MKNYGWLIAAVVLLGAAGGWMLYDEPLEPEAQAWLDAVQARGEGESVAYQLMMGLDAPAHQDPRDLGRQRLAAYAAAGPNKAFEYSEPPAGERLARPSRESLCVLGEADCFQRFSQDPDAAQRLLDEHALILQRYREVLAENDYRSQAVPGVAEPLPVYILISDGNRLLALQALLMAQQGDALGARRLLEDDIRQLRGQLARADQLIGKMIWTNLLSADLDVLARLRAEELLGALNPQSELDPAERDMAPALQHEFAGQALLFLGLADVTEMHADFPAGSASVLYKPRQSVNLVFAQARPLVAMATLDAVEFAEVAAREPEQRLVSPWLRPNNPIGVILANVAAADMRTYIGRLHDLNAKLRLFNLLARLPDGQLPDPAWLARQSDVQNPYRPGALPSWSERTGQLCYAGPLGDARGRCIRVFSERRATPAAAQP